MSIRISPLKVGGIDDQGALAAKRIVLVSKQEPSARSKQTMEDKERNLFHEKPYENEEYSKKYKE